MPAKSTLFDTDLLKLFFNQTDFATKSLAAHVGTSITNLYLSLHTSSPGVGGDQTTNEVSTAAYGQYARVAVARTSGGFTVSGASVTLFAPASWTAMSTGTGATITHFGVGTDLSGAGYLMYFGTVTPNIVLVNGVTPQLTTGTTITES